MPHHATQLNAPPETLDDDPPLARLLTRRLVAVTPDTAPVVAAEVMAAAGVRHLPVVDGHRCLGVLAEPDLLHVLIAPADPAGSLCRPAAELEPTTRRSAAAAAMHETRLDAVLVVERGRLLGIVTATDLVRSLVPPAGRDGTSDPGAETRTRGIVDP